MTKTTVGCRIIYRNGNVTGVAPLWYAQAIGFAPSALPWWTVLSNRVRDWLNRTFHCRFKITRANDIWANLKTAGKNARYLTPEEVTEFTHKLQALTGDQSIESAKAEVDSVHQLMDLNARYQPESTFKPRA